MGLIGVFADEGKPIADAKHALQRLVKQEVLDEDRCLPNGDRVEVATGTIPMTTDGEIELGKYAEPLLTANGWDKFVYITDLPLTAMERPVVSQSTADGNAVLLSQPAYGMFRARRSLATDLESVLAGEGATTGKQRTMDSEEVDSEREITTVRVLDHPGRALRLILGMIRSNEPGKLLGVLSGALAAIAATGGFGVFYGSIWNLSESMQVWRMLLVAALGVIVFSAWLIISNRLWIRSNTQDTRWRERIDNIATAGTVVSTVLIIFLLAAVGMTLLSVAVVPADFFREQIEETVTWQSYLRVGWLSASLGTFAGAIGSNFDKSVEIRSATYNLREYERRRKVGDKIDEAWEEGSLRELTMEDERLDDVQ